MSAIPEMGGVLETLMALAVAAALVQFVWQGALIGALTALTLAALRRSAPDVRYVVSVIGLSLLLTVPVVTAVQEYQLLGAAARGGGSSSVEHPSIPAGPAAASPVRTAGRPSGTPQSVWGRVAAGLTLDRDPARAPAGVPANAPGRMRTAWRIVLVLWTAGVFILTLRIAGAWLCIRQLRTRAAPARLELASAALRLARQLHVARPVRLLESPLVDVPTVIGWLKPVVLFPASALAGLSPMQLEAILAHELAHVRRHDYLINLLQTVVETLLFYHPAVWWVSRQIRVEREHCCDDLAVSLCGDPIVYAQALADLEELRAPGGRLAIAASGGSLLERVRRLIGPSPAAPTAGPLAAASSLVLVVLFAGLAGAAAQERGGAAQAFASFGDAGAAAQLREGADHAREGAEHLREGLQHLREQLEQLREAAVRLGEDLARMIPAERDLFEGVPPAPPAPPSPPAPPAAPADVFDYEPSELLPPPAPPPAPADVAVEAMPPVPPAPPAAPISPYAPAPAAPATPPAPPPAREGARQRGGQSSGNFIWSNGGERLEVQYRGDVEFSDDDSDVTRLEPGGYLRIRDGRHEIELRAEVSGSIARKFRIDGSEGPFEPEGRAWLARVLPRFIRQTGIGAPARAARIYQARGAEGMLAEISLIEGSFGKRIYFAELLKMPGLDARVVEKALAQAGREIDSDFELASLLIASERLAANEATRKEWFQAARTVGSDFEMRRVLSAALEHGNMAAPLLVMLLETATAIDSDFELASLLGDAAKRQPIEGAVRAPFFRAVGSVGSSFERGRVLQAVANRRDASEDTLLEVIRAADGMGSFESAQVLLAVAAGRPLSQHARAAYIDAAGRLGDFEQGRVLSALARSERR